MGAFYKILIALLCVALIILMQLGFIFMMLAMLPTFVSYYTDTDPAKSHFKIVAAGNISAMLPTFIPMFKADMNMQHYDVVGVLLDPTVWLFIYLGAAAGWGLVYLSRFLARIAVTMSTEYRISSLKKVQKQLVEEWGQEIIHRNH